MITRLMIPVCFFVVITNAAFAAEADDTVQIQLQNAALVGDWEQILSLLADVDAQTGTAEARLTKAHALLATNRNNDSFRLFASASDRDLAAWEGWAADLAEKHPDSSFANFYLADAQARLEKYDVALASFSKAIELNSNNAFAYHGRGVVHALLGKIDEAAKELSMALSISPAVADFHNSRSMLRIAQRQGNLVRLEQQFDKAIELSGDFALAYHGLGCVELLRGSKTSRERLDKAKNLLPEGRGAFAINEASFDMAIFLVQSDAPISGDDKGAGTTLERRITAQQMGHLADNYRNQQDKYRGMSWINLPAKLEARSKLMVMQTAINLGVDRMSDQQISKMDARTYGTVREAMVNERRSNTLHVGIAHTSEVAAHVGGHLASDAWTPGTGWAGGMAAHESMKLYNQPTHNYAEFTNRNFDRFSHIDPAGSAAVGLSKNRSLTAPKPTDLHGQTFPGSGQQPPGGAAIDKREVSWGSAPWPFMPIFGLVYGDMANINKVTELTGSENEMTEN